MMTRIMARLTFDSLSEAMQAETDLRAAGYQTDTMDDEELVDDFDDIGEATFMEAWKDIDDTRDIDRFTDMVFNEVRRIIDPHGGFCVDAGAVPDDHVPHRYDGW
jgi:hypothetical protein